MKKRVLEKTFFDQPVLYRIKRFVIEDLIWQVILAHIFGIKPNPMPDITAKFASQRVLVAACGPGNVTTGPPLNGALQVSAFDLSLQFAATCAKDRKTWTVYCGNICNIPLPLKVNSSNLVSPIKHTWLGVLDCQPSENFT